MMKCRVPTPTGGVCPYLRLSLVGLVLLACILQAEYLLLPPSLGELGQWLYRPAFFVILPFRALVYLVLPPVNHHFNVMHLVVACMGTPFYGWGLWRAGRWALRRRRQHRSPSADAALAHFIGRRQFLVRAAFGTVGVGMGGVSGYASLVAPERLQIRKYRQIIDNLPSTLEGLRIVHVSDTHYGPYTSLAYLEEVVAQANELSGDLIVLTGDYVHRTPLAIRDGIDVLGKLKGRLGRVAVLGNHDHWEDADACRAGFQRLGIPLIDNARLFLHADGLSHEPVDGETLCLAGAGDLWTDTVSLSDALRGVPKAMPRLLLSHNPDVAETLDPAYRVDLVLSGHTHGGQVRLPGWGVPVTTTQYGEKYLGGLCHGPRCPVVVSRGVGLAGIPLRFRVPPEVGLIELVRA